MKTSFAIVFSLLVSFHLLAQDTPLIDSLRNELRASNDTIKVSILLDLANLLKFDQPQEAVNYAMEALNEAQSVDFQQGIAKSYNILGIINAIRNNNHIALAYFLKSLKINNQSGNNEDIAYTLNNIANIYHLEKDATNALLFYKKALKIKASLADKMNEVSGLNSLGLAYTDYKMYEEATQCFNKIVELAQAEQKEDWIAKAYNQLGRNANMKGDYVNALKFYTKAVGLNKKLNRRKAEAIALSNLGEVYSNLKDYDMAIYYYKKSLVIRKTIGYNYGAAITMLKIAETYQLQSQYILSNVFAQQSLEIARKLGVKEFARDALIVISYNYARLKDFNAAYATQLNYDAINDSLFKEEKIKQLAEMQSRFDLETKVQQITSQQRQIAVLKEKELTDRNLKYALMIGALLLLLLLGFIYSRYRLKNKSEKTLQLKNREVEAKNEEIATINGELEKRMLRAQMDPHFIFNSLNSIQHFITINDKDSALPYLSKFSKLIGQVLENSVNQQVPVADEIKLLEYYVQLEALRFHDKFDYTISVGDNLDIYEHEVPFLLIQPYVENSIVHGIRHLENRGKLSVELTKCDEYIRCVVEDNGIGRKLARAKKAKRAAHISHGMPITAQRLLLLNRDRKLKTLVSVTDLYDSLDNPLGTRVQIEIPINIY